MSVAQVAACQRLVLRAIVTKETHSQPVRFWTGIRPCDSSRSLPVIGRRVVPMRKPGQAGRRLCVQAAEGGQEGADTDIDGGDGGSGGGKKKKTAPVPNDGGAGKGWWTFLPWKEILVAVVSAGVAAWMTLVLSKREKTATDLTSQVKKLITKKLSEVYDPEELNKLEAELGVELLPRDEVTSVLESAGDASILLGPSRCGKTTSVKLWGCGKVGFLYCSIRGYPDSWLAEALGLPAEYVKEVPEVHLRSLFLNVIKQAKGKQIVIMDDVQCLPTTQDQQLTANSKKLLASFIAAAAEKRFKLVFLASEAWVASELSTVSGASARVQHILVKQPPMTVLAEYLDRLLPGQLTPDLHATITRTSERNVGDLVKIAQTLNAWRAAGTALTEESVRSACYSLYEPDIRRIETFLESVASKIAGKDEVAGIRMAYKLFRAAMEAKDGQVQLRTLQKETANFDSALGAKVARALVSWNVFAKGDGVWSWRIHAPRIKHALAAVLRDKTGTDDLVT